MMNSGVSVFDNTRKDLQSNLAVVVGVLVLESKGVYYVETSPQSQPCSIKKSDPAG